MKKVKLSTNRVILRGGIWFSYVSGLRADRFGTDWLIHQDGYRGVRLVRGKR